MLKKLLLSAVFALTSIAGFAQENTTVGIYGDYEVWVSKDGTDIFMTSTIDGASFGISKPVDAEMREGRFILFLFKTPISGNYPVYLTYDGGATFVKETLLFSNGYANISRLVKKTTVDSFLQTKKVGIAVAGNVYFFGNEGVSQAIVALENYSPNPFGGAAGDNPFGNSQTAEDWVAEYELDGLNPFDLDSYVQVFIADALAYGIDINHVLEGDISIYFNSMDEHIVNNPEVIAYTDTLGDDDRVHVVVNPAAWVAASPAKRLAIIYHELGHDILNLVHKSDRGPLMSVYAREDFTFEELYELRIEMFEDYKRAN